MSRAVKEDLSDLPFGERMSKRWSNFQDWIHDSEKDSYFGERNATQWGQLCGYYLVFYLALAGFTAIFFGILGFMLPIRPTEVVLGVCNRDASAGDGCGPGPFFQAIDLYSTGERGDDRFTDEVLRFSLCEPGFVAIPRALNLGGGETVGYNKDDLKRGYTQFIYENDRVNCAGLFNDPTYNPSCTNSANAAQTAPLIPLKSDGSGIARYATPAQVRGTSNFFNNVKHTRSRPQFTTSRTGPILTRPSSSFSASTKSGIFSRIQNSEQILPRHLPSKTTSALLAAFPRGDVEMPTLRRSISTTKPRVAILTAAPFQRMAVYLSTCLQMSWSITINFRGGAGL